MIAEPHISTRREAYAIPAAAGAIRAIQVWSWVGTIILVLTVWFTVKWVLSDTFVAVASGPDVPPKWMRLVLDSGQILMTTAWCWSFYLFVIRPLMRERRMSTDGFILIGCTIASLWDALTLVGQYWFTYNSYLFNRGSILSVVPITLSPHTAGANEAWPLFFINTLYGNFVLVAMLLCALLRAVR
ncbi:MAG: spirocyclase AveC family protein, partial [Steroidobacteraceae bacterium]